MAAKKGWGTAILFNIVVALISGSVAGILSAFLASGVPQTTSIYFVTPIAHIIGLVVGIFATFYLFKQALQKIDSENRIRSLIIVFLVIKALDFCLDLLNTFDVTTLLVPTNSTNSIVGISILVTIIRIIVEIGIFVWLIRKLCRPLETIPVTDVAPASNVEKGKTASWIILLINIVAILIAFCVSGLATVAGLFCDAPGAEISCLLFIYGAYGAFIATVIVGILSYNRKSLKLALIALVIPIIVPAVITLIASLIS